MKKHRTLIGLWVLAALAMAMITGCVKDKTNLLRIDTRLGTNAPIMSTPTRTDKLEGTLFGKTRRAVLSLLFSHPDESYYLRQLAPPLRVWGLGALRRELKALSAAGIIAVRIQGRQGFFSGEPAVSGF